MNDIWNKRSLKCTHHASTERIKDGKDLVFTVWSVIIYGCMKFWSFAEKITLAAYNKTCSGGYQKKLLSFSWRLVSHLSHTSDHQGITRQSRNQTQLPCHRRCCLDLGLLPHVLSCDPPPAPLCSHFFETPVTPTLTCSIRKYSGNNLNIATNCDFYT